MTAQDLYDEFKDALDYLGVGFGGKDNVQVALHKDGLLMRSVGRSCIIVIPALDEEEQQ